MKKLYSTQDRVILYLFKAKLTEIGITTIIKNEEPTGPAAGEITPMIAWPELWVIDDQRYQEAHNFLQDELRKFSHSHREKWTCIQCGEKIEGQFDVCWRCGHSRDIG